MNLSQEEVASLLGISHVNYNKLENNKRSFSKDILKRMESIEGWPASFNQMWAWRLETEYPDSIEFIQDDTQYCLEHLGSIAAGPMTDGSTNHLQGYVRVPDREPFSEYCFGLTVRGDSMSPAIPDGSLIICRPDNNPRPNKLYVVQGDDGDATLKMVVIDTSNGKPVLKPLNPDYPLINLDDTQCYKAFEVVSHMTEWEMEPLES